MNDLVLRIRLDSLESNLTEVRNTLNSIKNQKIEIKDMQDKLISDKDSALNELKTIRDNIRGLINLVQKLQYYFLDLDPRERLLTDDDISTLETIISGRDQIAGLEAADKRLENLSDSILNGVGKDLSKIQKRLINIKPDDAIYKTLDSKAAAANKEIKTIKTWDAYDKFDGECAKIFSEYVDFLQGFALRNSILADGNLYRLADEFIRKKCDSRWNSLTIPAREEALTATLARIIRLKFPEWTIWALPLAAHEFGHVVASMRDVKLHNNIDEKSRDRPEEPRSYMEEYAADAFATYAMGPAYAYTAIFLRFNPISAYKDMEQHPADAKRAIIVFEILNCLKDALEVQDKSAVNTINTNIEKEWDSALKGTSGVEGIKEEEKEKIKQLARNFYNLFESKETIAIDNFIISEKGYKNFRVITPLAKYLNGETKELILNNVFDIDLRDIINAAWFARFKSPENASAIEAKALEMQSETSKSKTASSNIRGPQYE
jgi:hypothetical protein